jgi:hypothetical protein
VFSHDVLSAEIETRMATRINRNPTTKCSNFFAARQQIYEGI